MKTDNVKVVNTLNEQESSQEPEVRGELEEMIPLWKEKYGKLFKSTIDGESYIWRKIRRQEYVALMTDKSSEVIVLDRIYERQERIAKMVVLYPYDIDVVLQENGGLATTLADEVIVKSGFELSSTEAL